ncbi:conserved hypothetical protein [Ricinus communis]|uniref:CCHC-type domain-containing protein n=1 Tax=Ricinus communis TaxID=3988 RepID=B9SWI2_RICCO|nr:conserved hypothetical protein [Ricinus communis]
MSVNFTESRGRGGGNKGRGLFANGCRSGRNRRRGFYGGRSSSRNSKHVCKICNKSGHVATTCWHRLDEIFQGSTGSTQGSRGHHSNNNSSTPQGWNKA